VGLKSIAAELGGERSVPAAGLFARLARRASVGGMTTGGFGGFDAWLADPRSGTFRIDTPLVKCEIPVADIGLEDLARDRPPHPGISAAGRESPPAAAFIPPDNPRGNRHNALFVCLTQEDGHLVWSSPIYVFR
jgi:hypothetical protein